MKFDDLPNIYAQRFEKPVRVEYKFHPEFGTPDGSVSVANGFLAQCLLSGLLVGCQIDNVTAWEKANKIMSDYVKSENGYSIFKTDSIQLQLRVHR